MSGSGISAALTGRGSPFILVFCLTNKNSAAVVNEQEKLNKAKGVASKEPKDYFVRVNPDAKGSDFHALLPSFDPTGARLAPPTKTTRYNEEVRIMGSDRIEIWSATYERPVVRKRRRLNTPVNMTVIEIEDLHDDNPHVVNKKKYIVGGEEIIAWDVV